jgi:glucose/arabinose dehydrogenase
VNERDELGDDLVPDYITSVRDSGFYGWPYSYHGQNEDPRRAGERPDLVARAIAPDYALGAHTASLGLVFYAGGSFRSAIGVARSSASAARGTARSSAATRSCSCRSMAASRAERQRTS